MLSLWPSLICCHYGHISYVVIMAIYYMLSLWPYIICCHYGHRLYVFIMTVYYTYICCQYGHLLYDVIMAIYYMFHLLRVVTIKSDNSSNVPRVLTIVRQNNPSIATVQRYPNKRDKGSNFPQRYN